MASARYAGVSLWDIEQEFGVDRRTAQRMTKVLEYVFPDCFTQTDAARRKFWHLRADNGRMILAQGIRDSELAAIEIAIRRADRDGASNEVEALSSLRDRLLAAMAAPHARRMESDAEALLEAYGFASRPGPRIRTPPEQLRLLAEALKAPMKITAEYGAPDSDARSRTLEPYGLLLGARRYLVAKESGGDGRIRHFRLDRLRDMKLLPESFARDPGFDLERHAARAFGSYHSAAEFGDVVWRFDPRAAPVAAAFVFHPDQALEPQEDGSLIVRFRAGGWLEMAWHLYQWGDSVEVLEPATLRGMIAGHRRPDFDALP